MSASERRLAAIMFTDIVGYTRMSQARESLALELLEEHRGIVRPVLSEHGGSEVKTIGDAFLVEFKSALDAVLCAAEIQRKMAQRNSDAPPERRLQIRIGIHLGDVVHGLGDVYGDAVNVASRIETLAEPGGLCISQQVFESVRNKTDLGMTEMGEVELKNVELPMSVYRVELSSRGLAAAGSAPRERLAVLPFVNISPDPNDEYFADGLTEELISKLSEVRGLKVIARTSVMNYKRKEKKVSQIGRELDVGSIIEGSVRKAGSKIRVSVQLVDSKTEEHLWASNYDKELDDIFAIQSDVASKVAKSVSAGLFAPKSKETTNVDAYTMYLRGVQLFHDRSEKSVRDALALFVKAADRDQTFARAYAAISFAYISLCSLGVEDWDSVSAKAEPAALKAVQLDPDLAEGHAALAGVCSLLDRFDQATEEAGIAVRLNPNLADAHLQLGIEKATMGDLEGALESFERAYELNPLSIRTGGFLAMVALSAGKDQRAEEIRVRMVELDPDNPRALAGLAEYYLAKHDLEKAQEFLDRARKVEDADPIVRLDQGILYAMQGKRAEAEAELKRTDEIKVETARLYGRLYINTALGNLDAAFETLFRQAELHSWPFLIGSLPIFAELRKDPRYRVFAEKLGLPAPRSSSA